MKTTSHLTLAQKIIKYSFMVFAMFAVFFGRRTLADAKVMPKDENSDTANSIPFSLDGRVACTTVPPKSVLETSMLQAIYGNNIPATLPQEIADSKIFSGRLEVDVAGNTDFNRNSYSIFAKNINNNKRTFIYGQITRQGTSQIFRNDKLKLKEPVTQLCTTSTIFFTNKPKEEIDRDICSQVADDIAICRPSNSM